MVFTAHATAPSPARLAKKFATIVSGAWFSDKKIDPSATSEPNHVARLILNAPGELAKAIREEPGIKQVTVGGVFCHASPFAYWGEKGDLPRCELADLMIHVEIAAKNLRAERALFVQTKMGSMTSGVWEAPLSLGGLDATQRRLYGGLQPFCLEISGFPKKSALAKRKSELKMDSESNYDVAAFMKRYGHSAPFDLAEMPSDVPAGLVYAAIKLRDGKRHPTPWLIEVGRPNPVTTVGNFSVSFSDALAEMVTASDADCRFGLRTDDPKPPGPEWARLVKDVKDWANTRTTSKSEKSRVLGVKLKPSEDYSGVFLNVHSFCQRLKRSNDIRVWASAFDAASNAEFELPESVPRWVMDSNHYWISPVDEPYADIDAYRGSPPQHSAFHAPTEPDQSRGFGVLSIQLTLND